MPVFVIDTIKPKNGLSFPVVEAVDVFVEGYASLADAVTNFATIDIIDDINDALSRKANASDVETSTANLQGQIDQIVISSSAEAVVAPEVAAARVGYNGKEYSTLKSRLDTEEQSNSQKFDDVYDVEYEWESGSINSEGEEVAGDRNNYRSRILYHLNGKTISVKNESRLLAVAYYNGNVFVERSAFTLTSITIPSDTTYGVKILVSNVTYHEGDTKQQVLSGVVLPTLMSFAAVMEEIESVNSNLESEIQNTSDKIYNLDYVWESGSINAAGEEVEGDKNNYRSDIITYLNGKTITVINQSRFLAVAYYDGDTFVARTAFTQSSITIPSDTTYGVRIVVSNVTYHEGDTAEQVLSGIILPSIPSFSSFGSSLDATNEEVDNLSESVTALNVYVFGPDVNITFVDGTIDAGGAVSYEPTNIGNCMSSLIQASQYETIDVTIPNGYLGNVCRYQNGAFVSRGSWAQSSFIIENNGYDIVILLAASSAGHTKEDVVAACSVSVYMPSVQHDIEEVKKMVPEFDYLNKIICCDTGRNIIHFSVDDTWICLYDIITHNYSSIFENSFFAALKSLHDEYGICVTLNTFNTFSETPGYDISDLPSTYQSELQENKSWLRFAFHAESDQSNYNSSTGILASYQKFVSAIYTFTGDYGCIDRITRLGYFGGTLSNVLAIKNTEHGIIGLLCADSTSRDSYYLNHKQNHIVQNKGKYYDLENELVMIKTITRTLTDAPSEIESNPCYQKYVEIFLHEYESSAPSTFESVAQYANAKGYLHAFPSDIFV